jgi:hypothetical protein
MHDLLNEIFQIQLVIMKVFIASNNAKRPHAQGAGANGEDYADTMFHRHVASPSSRRGLLALAWASRSLAVAIRLETPGLK